MPSKKKDQQLLVQPEEKLKNSNVFLEPNLTLSGRTEILAFYKEKSEFLGDIKELTKEQIASQSVHTLVELLYYLRKDPEFFDSEEFDFIETNLSELFIDLDILALTSKVLDEEIEVDFSLISFEFYELEQIQEKYNNQPEKIAFFKKLLSADSIDEVEKQAVFDFFDIVESIDLAKQSKGLSTEKIQALLDSESSTDFLKKAFLHLDEFDQETKDAFLLQVESVDKSDLADCVISLARSGEISPEAFSYLEGLSSYYIKIIIKNLLSNNIFDEAYPYFESIWSNKDILYSLIEYEDEDITQSSFGIDLLKQFVGTKDRQEDFINQYVYSRGFQEFIANEKIFEILDPGLQLSKEWFLHFFASLQYSRDADLLTIPNEFGEMFELHDDILTSDITDGYNSKDIFFPEEWRKKIASKDLDQKDAELFLRRISYGRKESIIGIGGNELLTKVFEYEYGENVLRDVLYSCIENGWAKTPNELKDLFKNQKWDFFPLALLKTNDVQMIAIVAGKSRATVAEIPSEYLENNESLVRVFFKGCTQTEVKDALESELFQEAYPEYVEYANNLTSHGEKAMVIRCAVKDISLEEVSELIALARVQQHTLYKTTALLTGIHDTDIYWEDRKDRTVEGLFWDDELKRYVLEESNERISVKNLKDHILMNANPDDYESVFYLLNLAEEENNTLLKEEESLTQEDYNYIFDSLVGRTVSSIDVLKELGKRAGYDKPEDYESALVDSLAGYPTASSIENILALSEGSITVTRFKELSYSYLNLEIRFSPDTCKVMFDYAESLGEPYSQEEKRTFWNKFVSDFKEKGNIATLGADEVKVFLDEKVVEPSEARKLLEKYLSQGHTNGTELKKLFEYTVFSQEQIEELLEVYTSKSGSIDLHVLSVFHEFVGEHEYESPIISLNFSKYIDQKIDFGYLVAYLGKFNQYVTPEQVKNKVKEIAISGLKVTNELVDLMHNYDFDKSECRMLCEFGISKHIIATEAFIELHKKAEYSERQNLDFITRTLLHEDTQIMYILEHLCKSVAVPKVHEIAVEYAVSYKKINNQYLNTLKSVLSDADPDRLKTFNQDIREKDERISFFDDTELMNQQFGSSSMTTKYTEIYRGISAIEVEDEVSNLEENRIFLLNNLIFNENKGKFTQSEIKEILGEDIAAVLAELKQSVAQKVADEDGNWMLERDAAFGKYKVLSHGTGQARNRKKGVARSQEENLNVEAVVKAIVDGESGLGIRGEKATVGAFFNPGANGFYGGVDSGSAVLFFTEDLINSHVTVASDPMGADGHVGVDSESKKYVQIPNRALFNPQEGEIEGVNLDHGQMGDYILELRNILENNSELSNMVFETASKHLQEKYPNSIKILKEIHKIQREQNYPEASILWARDLYLGIRLSESESDQKLAGVVEKIVTGISAGVLEGDLRSYIDMVRLNWDEDLQKLSENPLGFSKLLSVAKDKMKQRQRKQFTTAARQLKSRRKETRHEKVGVAKQHMLQVKSAERHGDVQKRTITDNLRSTRALFMDTKDTKEYVAALSEVQNYAEYMKSVKESALLRTYQEGIDSLSQVDRVIFDRYKSKISVCSSGSIGRGEVVISSDIDYLVLVDDRELDAEDLEKIKRVLFKVGEQMNQRMIQDFNIRPDAGLANKDRQPIVLYSKVDGFSLDKSGNRQVLEPSEMMDIASVDDKDEMVAEFKNRFISRANELIESGDSASLFEYMDSKVASFDTLFNGGLSQLLSRDQLIDFKMQVQRIFNFYLYRMVAEKIPEIDASGDIIPNRTLDKIQFMADKGYIDKDLSARFYELQLMLYRLRYRTDVLNSAQLVEIAESEGRVEERAKIASKLDPQEISQQELSRFIELISFFSENIETISSVGTSSALDQNAFSA